MKLQETKTTRTRTVTKVLIGALVIAVWSSTTYAQSAQQVLQMLDADRNGVISQNEAQDQMKQNFTFIDTNGDGGIDSEELDRVLNMGAAQNGSQAPAGESLLLSDAANPSFGVRNPDATSFMMVSPEQDKMFYMLNLVNFRERAEYADGRETDLTGEQANGLYNPLPELQKVGGGVVYAGSVESQLAGMEPTWDWVGIVMYPNRRAIMEMGSTEEFQSTVVHKDAGLAASQIMLTIPDEAWRNSSEPPTSEAVGSQLAFLQLVKYRDNAEYAEGVDQPSRTGREAMDLFWKSADELLREAGVTRMLKATVDGVLIGDGREWDEYRILRFPNRGAFEDAIAKIQSSEAAVHYAAAVEDEYRLLLKDQLDSTANPLVPGTVGQSTRSPTASRAAMIFSALDANKDGKVSEGEAAPEMKANFAMIDMNGDGGIDADELERILGFAGSQQ